jgi:hypothetical protein
MSHATYRDMHIPGRYIFDGKAAMKVYALNKMSYSLDGKRNREEFLRGEDTYCTKYDLDA